VVLGRERALVHAVDHGGGLTTWQRGCRVNAGEGGIQVKE
jgi:hypothetical protein